MKKFMKKEAFFPTVIFACLLAGTMAVFLCERGMMPPAWGLPVCGIFFILALATCAFWISRMQRE